MAHKYITHDEIDDHAAEMAVILNELGVNKIYPIPRGGVPVAYAVSKYWTGEIVEDPARADAFVDDLIDSGATEKWWKDKYDKPFVVMVNKTTPDWIIFPWEATAEGSADDIVTRLLSYVGEDPARQGLQETPGRVLKAWDFWCSGYHKDPGKILKVFEDGAEQVDEMVVVKDIPLYSHCEHHLAPFFGRVHIGYVPNGKIVGLSKLSRLVKIFARRLQVQERLTNQIADALAEHLQPLGVGVVVEARHMCMESRGICEQGHSTITSAVRGVVKDKPEARQEFLALCRAK